MQNDLISRRELIETIKSERAKMIHSDTDFASGFRSAMAILEVMVEEQPTAYDVEKVVEKMGKTMISLPRTNYCSSDYENIKKHNQIVAKNMEIVRRGVKNEIK